MKSILFINKYNRIGETIAGAVPAGSEVVRLDKQCALLKLPKGIDRKEILKALRACVDVKEGALIQTVLNLKESADSYEVVLPDFKRFFPKIAQTSET